MRWVKPLDEALILRLLEMGVTHIATVEEHQITGGAGSAVNEFIVSLQALVAVKYRYQRCVHSSCQP